MPKLTDRVLIYRADTIARVLMLIDSEVQDDEIINFHYQKIFERLYEILPDVYTIDLRDPG